MINRTDLTHRARAASTTSSRPAKKLRGEPHGAHKGYVFSNAWVHQTVEAMCIALMIDPQGDPEIIKAHEKMRATLDDWIPNILAAQEPDGYLQTAFTLPPRRCARQCRPRRRSRIGNARGDHEGYVAGYFLESAINHYLMTDKKDARLYNAAKKLADCWYANLGPAPKKAVVRRPSGNGAGAGALRPLRERHGRRRQGRQVHPARQVPARLPLCRAQRSRAAANTTRAICP